MIQVPVGTLIVITDKSNKPIAVLNTAINDKHHLFSTQKSLDVYVNEPYFNSEKIVVGYKQSLAYMLGSNSMCYAFKSEVGIEKIVEKVCEKHGI